VCHSTIGSAKNLARHNREAHQAEPDISKFEEESNFPWFSLLVLGFLLSISGFLSVNTVCTVLSTATYLGTFAIDRFVPALLYLSPVEFKLKGTWLEVFDLSVIQLPSRDIDRSYSPDPESPSSKSRSRSARGLSKDANPSRAAIPSQPQDDPLSAAASPSTAAAAASGLPIHFAPVFNLVYPPETQKQKPSTTVPPAPSPSSPPSSPPAATPTPTPSYSSD
jgi:hypothetical protein